MQKVPKCAPNKSSYAHHTSGPPKVIRLTRYDGQIESSIQNSPEGNINVIDDFKAEPF